MSEVIKQHYDSLFYTDIVEEYFDHSLFGNFGYWEKGTENARQASENLMAKLLKLFPDNAGDILDVACGRGGTTNYLLKYYQPENVTAINVSQKQIDTAKLNAPGCNFITMDAANLEFAEASFDKIICVESAFHFHTREEFLRHAFRVLKPGGELVLSDVLIKDGGEKAMRTFHEANYIADQEAYSALCKKVNFNDVKIVDVTNETWIGHYWNIIKFTHSKFLSGHIDRGILEQFLENTYRFSPWMNKYLLIRLTKT